ncbi:MAG: hypothetical protein AAGC78_15530 [Cellvibrio sp.]|uniref:PepSY domain-containing protein n=1 Tax=Cellvibrio sp. TaxID=1965322 RepID=UPI0031B0BF58
MLYSKTFDTRPGLSRLPALLLAMLIFVSLPGTAEPDLLGGDLGLPSSNANDLHEKSLINPDKIKTAPAEPKFTPAEAAELVRNKVGGQVMSVNTLHNDDGVIYGVKVLNAGRMRVIKVDGQTGQLLNN